MNFVKNKTYCIHNTGNNHQRIFFSDKNKSYFRRKVEKFIAPFANIKHVSLYYNQFFIVIDTKKDVDLDLLNQNIGVMLSSYTRGVNKEQNRLGSLFRQGTKAYQKFSDFPKHIREKFIEFREFFLPSRIVKYGKSAVEFLKSVDDNLRNKNSKFKEYSLFEILKHPRGFNCKEYLLLYAKLKE